MTAMGLPDFIQNAKGLNTLVKNNHGKNLLAEEENPEKRIGQSAQSLKNTLDAYLMEINFFIQTLFFQTCMLVTYVTNNTNKKET